MAPKYSEEVDVFSVPHTRMKELVKNYREMLPLTNFSSAIHLTSLLEKLHMTFQEFMAHEQIENKFIMRKLKDKLQKKSIMNSAVCNCHKDNRLIDMMDLFRDGFKCTKKSAQDRINYGIKLCSALDEFTQKFLPHMEEEEEVFQPLLVKHFSYEELKNIKTEVIQQHRLCKGKQSEVEKYVEDPFLIESSEEVAEEVAPADSLPDEVWLNIFSYLNPRELCQCAQVSHRLNSLGMDGSLWKTIRPVLWAKGDWTFHVSEEELEEDEMQEGIDLQPIMLDMDADIDEAADDYYECDDEVKQVAKEAKLLTLLIKYFVTRIGPTLQKCVLAFSKGLTSSLLDRLLFQCPNLEYLDVTHTKVFDKAFRSLSAPGFGRHLKHLKLSGCVNITNKTLQWLSAVHKQSGNLRNSASCLLADTGGGSSFDQHVHSHFIKVNCAVGNNEDLIRTKNEQHMYCPWVGVSSRDCFLKNKENQILDSDYFGFSQMPLQRMFYAKSHSALSTEMIISPGRTIQFPPLIKGDETVDHLVCEKNLSNWQQCDKKNELVYLNLSGCHHITDTGLRALSQNGGLPCVQYLDLSGCLNITAKGLQQLVETCTDLNHENLFYCDNLLNDPYARSASGCQNLHCMSRVCCRTGE